MEKQTTAKMLQQENLAANFCGLLVRHNSYKKSAIEWRILGQEQDGSLLASWVSVDKFNERQQEQSNIGLYNPTEKSFRILYSFEKRENCVQATVNANRTLLAFVLKDLLNAIYTPFVVEINSNDEQNASEAAIPLLADGSQQQVMTQFLWQRKTSLEEKLLLFVHDDCISLLKLKMVRCPTDDESNVKCKIDFRKSDTLQLDRDLICREVIVKHFIWAQWDPTAQALYYIHLKPTMKSSLEKDDTTKDCDDASTTTTLSAHQFHENLPRETVLNIPLNLPNIPRSSVVPVYDDDIVPLRIHDSTLNLIIVTDESGMLFVCHYCVYQPIHLPIEEETVDSAIQSPSAPQSAENVTNDSNTVHFSYSVTLLHHGCIIHCAIPGIPLTKAKFMKPTFTMHGDHHMLVFQPDLFCHLLDVGLTHEPCCHIVCAPRFNPQTEQVLTHLVPCLKWGAIAYDATTLNLVSINVPKSHLIDAFKNDKSIDNRLSIVHYFLMHSNDMDSLSQLIAIIMEQPANLDTVPLLKEAFIAGAYASTTKSLPKDALPLARLLPLTSSNTKKPIYAKINNLSNGISHETLHSTTMMLLSPQQRLSPFKVDIWTKLWEKLNENSKKQPRFSSEMVAEKLLYSLACYQPEALSRCTTPMSPGGALMSPMNFIDYGSRRTTMNNVLPFLELETCTATKQEHVISVNLRELSVYLVKHTAKQNTGFRWLKDANIVQAPSHVNTVASQYAAAQLELSRALCAFVCRAGGVDARLAPCRGLTLIDTLQPNQQEHLFSILERFYSAAESIAFPLPQGFASFFCYLGFRALHFKMFLQYVDHHVFELQIDVINGIFKAIGNSSPGASEQKHLILSKVPRSRSNRILKNLNDSRSLRVLGRDHANAILSGISSTQTRKNSKNIAFDTHSHSVLSSGSCSIAVGMDDPLSNGTTKLIPASASAATNARNQDLPLTKENCSFCVCFVESIHYSFIVIVFVIVLILIIFQILSYPQYEVQHRSTEQSISADDTTFSVNTNNYIDFNFDQN